jgi:RNA polymerase primary sigma factor
MRQIKIGRNGNSRKTNRSESDSLQKYLTDITKIPRISPDRERELAQRIQKGDQKALDELVEANLYFVIGVAKQYQNLGLTLPDLINEGNYGLIKAAQRFDESKGFKFISYAVWWCRQSILVGLAEQAKITRIPPPEAAKFRKASQLSIQFEQENERQPTVEELSEMIKLGTKHVGLLLASNARHIELDAPLSNDGSEEGKTKGDLIDSGELTDIQTLRNDFNSKIRSLLKMIPPQQADAIIACFKLDGDASITREEVQKKYGYKSLIYIQGLKDKGLQSLRMIPDHKELGVYLDSAISA